jgi:hypothetical protein
MTTYDFFVAWVKLAIETSTKGMHMHLWWTQYQPIDTKIGGKMIKCVCSCETLNSTILIVKTKASLMTL